MPFDKLDMPGFESYRDFLTKVSSTRLAAEKWKMQHRLDEARYMSDMFNKFNSIVDNEIKRRISENENPRENKAREIADSKKLREGLRKDTSKDSIGESEKISENV